MFLTSFLNIYLNMFLSIYFEAMVKKMSPIKIQNAISCCFQKHSQIVGETYIVPAIQPCLICSTLPVEFNRRGRSCLVELFKS